MVSKQLRSLRRNAAKFAMRLETEVQLLEWPRTDRSNENSWAVQRIEEAIKSLKRAEELFEMQTGQWRDD